MTQAEQGLLVLIADDSDTDRLLLQAIIKSQGHIPITARDGLEAIALFREKKPDIILLDALMPNMDGFDAARHIKANMGDDFIPIIFLTSLHDADSLALCLEAGGDDFLSKPYQNIILGAKINAFRRMQSMHKTLQAQRDQIYINNQRLIREQEVAKLTFDKVAHEGALHAKNIRYSLSPMAIFNGDVLLAAVHPNGDLCVLLGDFTGHGLAAAMGAMPLSQTFYSMVAKGFAIRFVAREINKKLKEVLPVGVFCCSVILQFNFHQRTVEVFNAAMPDIYLVDPEAMVFKSVASSHLALGILSDQQFNDSTHILPMPLGSKLLTFSDGVIEAENNYGKMFGSHRVESVINESLKEQTADRLIERLKLNIDDFVGTSGLSDDISIASVRMCSADEFSLQNKEFGIKQKHRPMTWRFSYELEGQTLRYADPTPVIQKLIQDAPIFSTQMSNIYTVLSELFVNALDHGVLGLSSEIKQQSNGFKIYYAERLKRLESLTQGLIRFDVEYRSCSDSYSLKLSVSDSGEGFDYKKWSKKHQNSLNVELPSHIQPLSGRGLALVKKLTDSLAFSENGSRIEVEFKT